MSTPLVLLHGWGLSARVWTPVVQSLPAGIPTLTPDLPGHGTASAAPSADLTAWSETVLAGLPPTMTLCGWSLGGLIAMDLARRYPERIARVILMATSARFVATPDAEPPWPHGLDASIVQGFIDGYATDPAATLRRFTALQTMGDTQRRVVSSGLAETLSPLSSVGRGALADGLHVLAQSDLRAMLDEIHQPVRIIHGAGDALMPIAGAKWLAGQLPHASLDVFDGCGHAPLLSRPADCAALIAGWESEGK